LHQSNTDQLEFKVWRFPFDTCADFISMSFDLMFSFVKVGGNVIGGSRSVVSHWKNDGVKEPSRWMWSWTLGRVE